MSVAVIKPGLLTTIQDRGRYGHAAMGVGHSGPMDNVSARLANALVGNAPDCAVLETTLLGPTLRFDADALIAVTGARVTLQVSGAAAPMWRPLFLPAGSELQLPGMVLGARAYIAVAGGWKAPRVLGSASVDLNAGLGSTLRAHDVLHSNQWQQPPWLPIGNRPSWPIWSLAMDRGQRAADRPFRFVAGAHFASLTKQSQQRLLRDIFEVAASSNRVGYRLAGIDLKLDQPLELISEAVDFGTMQWTPSGAPIILMAEHPTTGGYPRIAQIIAADLPRLGQCRPGDRLRFARVTIEQAQFEFGQQERRLQAQIDAIRHRLREGWRS